MLNKIIKFPIWKDDGKAVEHINNLQKQAIKEFLTEIRHGNIKFEANPCLCGNSDTDSNLVVTEKDRYGIYCVNVLCKKCGLIRLKEKMDNQSTALFYKKYYRNIYVGKKEVTENFFNDQVLRGKKFLKLFNKYVGVNKIETVFEIGCGAGGILYPFYEIDRNVSGCDFGEKYLKFGQRKGMNLYVGEINEKQTPKKSQDLIILSHIMEHFNQTIKTMNDIIEYIKFGKYLLVEVPGIFDIPKTYFNPILYFQNAHVHNYYYYYLKVFFEKLGLNVIYGNERCTFILQKPMNWVRNDNIVIYNEKLLYWAKKVEISLKKNYLQHILKLNPYYYKRMIIKILVFLKLENFVKKYY